MRFIKDCELLHSSQNTENSPQDRILVELKILKEYKRLSVAQYETECFGSLDIDHGGAFMWTVGFLQHRKSA